MKKTSLVLIAMLALFGLSIFSGCARTIEAKSEFMMNRITGDLDLNKDQQAALNVIRLDAIQKMRSQEGATLQLKNDFVALVKSDTMDPVKLKALKTRMQALQQEMDDQITPKMIAFQNSLTPAQKNKVAGKIEYFFSKMQETLDLK